MDAQGIEKRGHLLLQFTEFWHFGRNIIYLFDKLLYDKEKISVLYL